jgi:hypothetical protein
MNSTALAATTGGAPMLCAAIPAGTAPSGIRPNVIIITLITRPRYSSGITI